MTRSKKSGPKDGAAPAAAPEQPAQAPQQDGTSGKKEGGKRNDACCVFVGNVAFTTTWQKLKDVMRKAGEVDLVELVVDSSHKPKGSALVSFKNEGDAKNAVATLNGTQVDGREILVRAFEKGARPLVIYGNYTREQLSRVLPKDKAPQAPAQVPPQQDRVAMGRGQGQGGRQEWRVHDGGDFNKRNRDTFGDEAVSYGGQPGNGMPQAAGMPLPASQMQMGGERKKLFVSNLPFSCTWKLLKDTFSQVGKVLRADIIMDDRGRSRGMGTVVFSATEEAHKAIEEFDGIEMDGRPMGVRLDRDFLGPHH